MHLPRFRRNDGSGALLAQAAGTAAVLCVLALVWLSADPVAHEYFHHDANRADHHCGITDFALGEGYFVAPRIVVPPEPMVFRAVDREGPELLRPPCRYLLLPTRGPPLGAEIS
ncbi:MAG: hypothetical protein ACREFX_08520 [Opitutaceae bacterium]